MTVPKPEPRPPAPPPPLATIAAPPLITFDAWALARVRGGLVPVRVRVGSAPDGSVVEAYSLQVLLPEDYRAVAEPKVQALLRANPVIGLDPYGDEQ